MKFSTLKKERGTQPIFEGERAKAKDIVNKEISITAVSNVLTGEFGEFKIIQVKLGKKIITFPVNARTAIYADLETIGTECKAGKTVETKLIRVPSKSTKGRSYYQFQ